MDQNLIKVTLVDDASDSGLAPKSYANSIYFTDGETLQFKYDNGTLLESGILGGIQAVSPTIEIYENEPEVSYKLKIKDINGVIITPNLIGPKGPKGDLASVETGDIVEVVKHYELQFVANDMQKLNEKAYIIRINRTQHQLGFGAKVTEVVRYISDTESVNVDYSYKRLVNGDIIVVFNEPFAGIIYLQGENE